MTIRHHLTHAANVMAAIAQIEIRTDERGPFLHLRRNALHNWAAETDSPNHALHAQAQFARAVVKLVDDDTRGPRHLLRTVKLDRPDADDWGLERVLTQLLSLIRTPDARAFYAFIGEPGPTVATQDALVDS